MFTGIVEDKGAVVSVVRKGAEAVIGLSTRIPLGEVRIGDSINVSGACLTVTRKGTGRFESVASAETLGRTTLSSLKVGAPVNLERALSLSGRLDGHLVYGHVDGTGTVKEIRPVGMSRVFHIRTDPSIMKFVVQKGSVAVDGVSLTVSALHADAFEVTVIPATLERTTFGELERGVAVNIETDIVGKYVLRHLSQKGEGVSLEFLKKHGFA